MVEPKMAALSARDGPGRTENGSPECSGSHVRTENDSPECSGSHVRTENDSPKRSGSDVRIKNDCQERSGRRFRFNNERRSATDSQVRSENEGTFRVLLAARRTWKHQITQKTETFHSLQPTGLQRVGMEMWITRGPRNHRRRFQVRSFRGKTRRAERPAIPPVRKATKKENKH